MSDFHLVTKQGSNPKKKQFNPKHFHFYGTSLIIY